MNMFGKKPVTQVPTSESEALRLSEWENRLRQKEIELIRDRKILESDKEVFSRQQGNWDTINKYREERREAVQAEAKEIGRAEGRSAALKELNAYKDNEITTLKSLLSQALSALQANAKRT